jgi:hypothetical protein
LQLGKILDGKIAPRISHEAKIAGRFWETAQKRTGNCECTRANRGVQEKVYENVYRDEAGRTLAAKISRRQSQEI